MTTVEQLRALGNRVQAASGPDRRLDVHLMEALDPRPKWRWNNRIIPDEYTAPSLTASIDAAAALVEKTARSTEHAVAIIAVAVRKWAGSGPTTPSLDALPRAILTHLLKALESTPQTLHGQDKGGEG